MNSKVMMLLAGVMLLGAVIAGYLGLRASAQPQKAALQAPVLPVAGGRAPAENGRYAVVIAGRELPPSLPIKPEDLYVEYLRQVPPQTYGRVEELVGKRPMVSIPVGAMITEAAMLPGGDLSKLVRPGERAMAIAVDEVVGGGGFVRPGDFVDVLLYVKSQSGGRDQADNSAQVVLSALRVLSYGPRLAPVDTATKPAEEDDKSKQDAGNTAKTAVLSVPEEQMTKLVLASNEGVLRLAVRSALEQSTKVAAAQGIAASSKVMLEDERRLITARSLLPNRAVAAAPVQRVASAPAKKATTAKAAPAKSSVIIQRGSAVQQVVP